MGRYKETLKYTGATAIIPIYLMPSRASVIWLLTTRLGTSYQADIHGAILLIEEVAEPAFRVDLMLTHLKQAGVF